MPVYSYKITNSPLEEKATEIEVEGDFLTNLSLKFPTGCCGLFSVSVFYGIKQIFPYEENTDFRGDDEVIEWDGLYELPERPCKLIIKTKNEDDSYDHTVFIRLATKYKRELPEYRMQRALKRAGFPAMPTITIGFKE